jgi:hypothetical protein
MLVGPRAGDQPVQRCGLCAMLRLKAGAAEAQAVTLIENSLRPTLPARAARPARDPSMAAIDRLFADPASQEDGTLLQPLPFPVDSRPDLSLLPNEAISLSNSSAGSKRNSSPLGERIRMASDFVRASTSVKVCSSIVRSIVFISQPFSTFFDADAAPDTTYVAASNTATQATDPNGRFSTFGVGILNPNAISSGPHPTASSTSTASYGPTPSRPAGPNASASNGNVVDGQAA